MKLVLLSTLLLVSRGNALKSQFLQCTVSYFGAPANFQPINTNLLKMDINALTLDSEVPPVQLVHVILWLETRVNSDVQVGNQN